MLTLLALFAASAAEEEPTLLEVRPGHSVVLELPRNVLRYSITAEKTARAVALDAKTLMIQGVALGTTDLVVTYKGSDRVDQYDISVTRDIQPLRKKISATPAPTANH